MPLKWQTGDEPPVDEFVDRRLLIPNDFYLVIAVTGALLPLTEPANWEQLEGDLTPEESAALMSEMFADFLVSDE